MGWRNDRRHQAWRRSSDAVILACLLRGAKFSFVSNRRPGALWSVSGPRPKMQAAEGHWGYYDSQTKAAETFLRIHGVKVEDF